MNWQELYAWVVRAYLGLAVVVFLVLLRLPAGYGRHGGRRWGPALAARPAWVLMESPAILATILFFLVGRPFQHATAWVFLALWLTHYGYRTLVYPFLIRSGNPVPVVVVAMGFLFNVGNAFLNGGGLFLVHEPRPVEWLRDPRFLLGLVLFLGGLATHVHSDHILRNLRAPGETWYRIPRGGLFRWVTSPNYLGEWVQWTGWAILTWSVGGLVFSIWTAANLFPRAVAHHAWYRDRFPDYPPDRRAILPGIW